MIRQKEKLFILDTKNTSYIFKVLPSGHLEHLHYGRKITLEGNGEALDEKYRFNEGNLLSYSKEFPQLGLENRCLEMSSIGKGDIREPFIEIIQEDGSTTCDFLFRKAEIIKGKKQMKTLPSSYDDSDGVEELKIELWDANYKLRLIISYFVFEKCDVITRSAKLINDGDKEIKLERLMSMQLDFDNNDYNFTTFYGAWAREMNRCDRTCDPGMIVNASMTGTSSNRNNPFVMVSENEANEDSGDCYGVNLIYSGNHYEALQVNSYGKMRLVSGINPKGFQYIIGPSEGFEAPEAVMTFSHEGFNGMSHRMHDFIREHIVRGTWKYKERPIVVNSWEAAYFNFNEQKLLKMAKAAKDVGAELFVLDDGWFGKRNDDTCSLGDWYVNLKKLPGGLKSVADKINALGMDFGIWVEPEMVNEDSDCYRAHPEWVVGIPGKPHSFGRHQMILDLSKEEVQNYVIGQMKNVFESANISYVKWDMNRIFSDYYSNGLEVANQQEFSHKYVLGLYKVMNILVTEFPEILFESCASGGNRFDLGMLCYMPQIWASDNTDAICRANIQTGYSYGYPMSTISAHVSGCPNHQTLRNTPIETRFNVACFGILGYECNISELNKNEFEAVKNQIELYKKYRNVLQFGEYYRIENGINNSFNQQIYQWITVTKDKSKAIGLFLQGNVIPNLTYAKFKTKGLADEKKYRFTNRELKYNIKEFGDLVNTVSPIHIKKDSIVHNIAAKMIAMEGEKEDYILYGDALNYSGVKLKQGFGGVGYDREVRLSNDFSSRIYLIEEI